MGEKMEAALKRLQEIREKNLQGGGQKHIDRQHGRGKLTARERIDFLLDPGTFSELGSFVNTTGARIDGRETDAPCDGAVIGTGKVDGRLITVYASDFTVLGGSLGCQHATKFIKLIEHGGGLADSHGMAARFFRRKTRLQGCPHGRYRLVVCS